MRFESASTARVDALQEEVSELLHHLAMILKELGDTIDEWLSYAFVSDESRLADFFFQDSELAQLEKLSSIDGLKMRDLICDVASSLKQKRRAQ